MPADSTESELFKLVKQLVQDANDNAKRTADGISGLRWEVRIIVVLALILGAARDGVFAKIGIPGVTIETRTAEATRPPEAAPTPVSVPGVGTASASTPEAP